MKPRLLSCLFLPSLLLLLSIPGFPSMEEAGKGMVYGPGHAYLIGAPSGLSGGGTGKKGVSDSRA